MSSGGEVDDSLWIDSGVVRADAFRWASASDTAAAISADAPDDPAADETRLVAPLAAETHVPEALPSVPTPAARGSDLSAPIAPDPPEIYGKTARPASARTSLAERLEMETDHTIEAIRLAEMRGDSGAETTGFASALDHLEFAEHRPDEPVSSQRAWLEEMVGDPGALAGVDSGSTTSSDFGEVVPEAGSGAETVEALVCSACVRPNPPAAARCRGCDAVFADGNSEHRLIAQPHLGVICLADGRIEPLDADIVVGRNPAREPLDPHQRAVVHGEGNRYVSRRHIEVRREGWDVVILNLKEGPNTTVESRRGGHMQIPVGMPHKLKDGDTVHFGRSWFRYEEGV